MLDKRTHAPDDDNFGKNTGKPPKTRGTTATKSGNSNKPIMLYKQARDLIDTFLTINTPFRLGSSKVWLHFWLMIKTLSRIFNWVKLKVRLTLGLSFFNKVTRCLFKSYLNLWSLLLISCYTWWYALRWETLETVSCLSTLYYPNSMLALTMNFYKNAPWTKKLFCAYLR